MKLEKLPATRSGMAMGASHARRCGTSVIMIPMVMNKERTPEKPHNANVAMASDLLCKAAKTR